MITSIARPLKYLATLLIIPSFQLLAATPQEQTTSAFIQLESVLDGTQDDIEIPGMPTPRPYILGFVAKNKPDLASTWIDEGRDLQDNSAILCTDIPEDFLMEDNASSWFYRDTRTMGCSWRGQSFSLKIEVMVEEKGGNSSWVSTEIQSVE